MKRRSFHQSAVALATVAAGGGLLAAGGAQAQSAGFVEGQHFVRLAQPVPGSTPGRIEVVEFFWYECPHCNAFEPVLEAWSKRLPADVQLRRVPVAFRENPKSAVFRYCDDITQLLQVHIFASLALFSDGFPSFPQKKCMRVNKTHMHEYSSSFQRFTWMRMHNLPHDPFTEPAKIPGCGDPKMIRIYLHVSYIRTYNTSSSAWFCLPLLSSSLSNKIAIFPASVNHFHFFELK